MIITDMNKMSLEELGIIHDTMGISYVIKAGQIVGSVHEKSTATDGKSEQC